MLVILGVIFMTGGRQEDRIEIDCLYAQFLQIIQLIDHPLQVTAVKLSVSLRRRYPVPVFDTDDRFPQIAVLAGQDVIRWISVAETVRKDLVHYSALCPGRCVIAGNDMPPVRPADRISHTAPRVLVLSPLRKNLKIVAQRRFGDLKLHCIIVKTQIRLLLAHAQIPFSCHKEAGLRHSLYNTQPYGNFPEQIRL